jgi:hypothetical protein
VKPGFSHRSTTDIAEESRYGRASGGERPEPSIEWPSLLPSNLDTTTDAETLLRCFYEALKRQKKESL